MPEIPNVVPGEPVESQWGNAIRDRVAQRYADATARDTETPIPDKGELAWLDDPGELTICVDESGPVWEPIPTVVVADGRYVNVGGDTMAGNLSLSEFLLIWSNPGDPSFWRAYQNESGEWLLQQFAGGSVTTRLRGIVGGPVQVENSPLRITTVGSESEPAVQFANEFAGIYRLPGNLLGIVSNSAERIRISGSGLEVRPGNDIDVLDGEITLIGSGTDKIRYTNAGAAIQSDRDAVWVSTGVGQNYRLDTIGSLASAVSEVADLIALHPAAETAKANHMDGPTLREVVHALALEVADIRARLDALES